MSSIRRTPRSSREPRSTPCVSPNPGHTHIGCGEVRRNESSAPSRGHRSRSADRSVTAHPFIGTFTVSIPSDGVDLPGLLRGVEGVLIAEALARTDGNRTHAARLLGLKRTALIEKLKRHPRLAEVQS